MSNSLVAVHPELIVEWSDRNLPLTPDSVTFGSNKKVWWKGTCGHEWQTSMFKSCLLCLRKILLRKYRNKRKSNASTREHP